MRPTPTTNPRCRLACERPDSTGPPPAPPRAVPTQPSAAKPAVGPVEPRDRRRAGPRPTAKSTCVPSFPACTIHRSESC